MPPFTFNLRLDGKIEIPFRNITSDKIQEVQANIFHHKRVYWYLQFDPKERRFCYQNTTYYLKIT